MRYKRLPLPVGWHQLSRSLLLFLCSGLGVAATAPGLTYSAYLRNGFTPNAIATDSSGNIYLAGSLVTKLNPQTGEYIYTTLLKGPANAIAVDATGNAYVAGSFGVVKLDAGGNIVFANPLVNAEFRAQAIAVNVAGRILVSGISLIGGFPTTPGAWSVPNPTGHPFLLELDPTGTKTIFSATGIGGSAIAFDSSGDIYVAGTTVWLDYPTTPGAYQTVFPAFYTCSFPCQVAVQGPNQYVSLIDPTGSKLIYSTALTGNGGATNAGLAVDGSGNVYVTGFAGGGYPFTVAAPVSAAPPGCAPGIDCQAAYFDGLPFLSKLDPSGQTLLFSVPVGGAGVQVDSSGNLDVGGSVGIFTGAGYAVTADLPVLSDVPGQCLPNGVNIEDTSYVSQVDASSGGVLSTQFLGGATLTISGVALSGSTLWIAGATADPEVPSTSGGLTLPPLPASTGAGTGGYLGAVNFSFPQPTAGTPRIACVLDAGDLTPLGPAARYQLLSIFGSGLGPEIGVSAADYSTTTLAGMEVTIGGVRAPLLYVSSTQINLAVPLLPYSQTVAPVEISTVSELPIGSKPRPRIQPATDPSARAFPLVDASPSVVMNAALTLPPTNSTPGFVAFAVNADASLNSPTNPAQLGSVISVYVNGLAPDPNITSAPVQFSAQEWTVTNVHQPNPFLWEVGLLTPSALTTANSFSCPPDESPLCTVNFSLFYTQGASAPSPVGSGEAASAVVYVTR